MLKVFNCNRLVISLSLLIFAGYGCRSSDLGPAEVLSEFLEAMDRSRHDSDALRDAYMLLNKEAQRSLRERARKAETLAGSEFKPWEMLAAGRFKLRFAPNRRGGIHAEIDGNKAMVVVTGAEKDQEAKVPMVREDGRWRVVLKIP